MEEGRPSAMAIGSAMVRAAHLLWDEDPKIFQDHLALRLSGFESEAVLQATSEAIRAENARRSTPEIAQSLSAKFRRDYTAFATSDEWRRAGQTRWRCGGGSRNLLPTADTD